MKNMVDKIWEAHSVAQSSGHPEVLAIDFTLLHEVTSAQAFAELEANQSSVRFPSLCMATIDHSIPTRANRHETDDVQAAAQMDLLRKNCAAHDIKLHDIDSGQQGIVHVIGPELGVTQPGMTLVCGDSHTATHGAFGALAFGIGTSTLAHVLATGALLMHKPKVLNVHFEGQLPAHCSAKDLILMVIAQLGVGGATGHVIEYTGQAIEALSMEGRMTLCNMSIECGAVAGLVAPDATTYEYLVDKPHAPEGKAWNQAITYWDSLRSDPGCHYDRTVTVNANHCQPMVTWGTNPAQAVGINQPIPHPQNSEDVHASAYTQVKPMQPWSDFTIDWAFVGSCTNGRIEDLRTVANILADRKLAEHVTMYIVPGSEQVHQQAIEEGLDHVFEQAGASFRLPGCSMCLAMNDDIVPPGARCISTTNRNFIGRQGTDSITHLASPATVAHSALLGYIHNGALS